MIRQKSFFFLVFCFFIFQARSQDVEFSQYYFAPLHLNPAMAGINPYPRIIFNYRNQWPRLNNAFVTYASSYDQYIEKIHGGIGLQVLSDRAGNGMYNATSITACYAYQLNLTEKTAVQIGLQPSFTQRSINAGNMTFSDMIDNRYGFIYSSNQTITNTSVNYFDVNAGAFIFSKKLYGGVGVRHLLFPNESLIQQGENYLPVRVAIHTGAIIKLNKNSKIKSYLSPNILFINQGLYQQLNIGSYLGKEPVLGGLWFRHTFLNSDALIALIGLSIKKFKIAYSYDWTVSRLAPGTGGSHEISIMLGLGKNHSEMGIYSNMKKQRIIECYDFF